MVHPPVPVQKVSHAHEVEQSMPPVHELSPMHSTRQRPAPQLMAPAHEALLVHSITQLAAALQSMPAPQEESPLHSTLHLTPAGQTTWVGHEPAAAQVMTHRSAMQDVQPGGQTKASAAPASAGGPASIVGAASPPPSGPPPGGSTHQPSWSQTRPPSQSLEVVQVKSGVRRSKLQPASRVKRMRTRALKVASPAA